MRFFWCRVYGGDFLTGIFVDGGNAISYCHMNDGLIDGAVIHGTTHTE